MANMLLEKGVQFSFVCGVSAGASHTVNYLSRDPWRVKGAFTMLPDRIPEAGGFLSMLSGHGYFNADYDYWGCIEDGYMPFDWGSFSANPADLRIQSFAAETGETIVWSRADMPDLRELMDRVRASSTLPFLMKPIRIDGHTMYDGGLGRGAGIPVRLAEDRGFEKMVFVATRPAGYRKKPPSRSDRTLYKLLAQGMTPLYEAMVSRSERYNAELDHVAELERTGRALVIRPDEMPVKSTTIKTSELLRSYDLGYAQALRDWPRVERYLFG
ncbi:patatin family protein [Coriobacteriales bacterium OH1046]|nr:patatin family protein [Coriobacteriales bacterium OH1046]